MNIQERTESLLMTIDRLGMAKIRHLRIIHDMRNYRYACYVISQLKEYVNTIYFEREKVFYLNKNGRDLIGSTKEITKASQIEHTLLRNEAYIYFNFPFDWENEKVLEYDIRQDKHVNGIILKNMRTITTKKIIADAHFTRNGYTHIIEIDNKRDMKDNYKKILNYHELFKTLKMAKLEIFTTTQTRKQKFEEWIKAQKISGNVYIYDEIKVSIP